MQEFQELIENLFHGETPDFDAPRKSEREEGAWVPEIGS